MASLFHKILLAVAAACTLPAAASDDYPNRPIRILVAFPPGGLPDLLARMVGTELTTKFGQPVVVDNKPGAGGNIATEMAAKAPPDGYVCLMSSSSALSLNPHLYKNLPYNVKADLKPVSQVASSQLALIASPSLNVNSIQDLVKLAKDKPGALNYASVGAGTVHHVAMELFQRSTGTTLAHIPYKGIGPATLDLIAGRIGVMLTNITEAQRNAEGGKVRILAVTGNTRAGALPNVPTIGETVAPGYDVQVWYGLVCPARTPDSIVQKLSAGIAETFKTRKITTDLEARDLTVIANTPAEFNAAIERQSESWRRVVEAQKIRLD